MHSTYILIHETENYIILYFKSYLKDRTFYSNSYVTYDNHEIW